MKVLDGCIVLYAFLLFFASGHIIVQGLRGCLRNFISYWMPGTLRVLRCKTARAVLCDDQAVACSNTFGPFCFLQQTGCTGAEDGHECRLLGL